MANVEPDSWTHGLQQNGKYYEGVVSLLDDRLEAHKRETVTTWGTRTSFNSKPASDCEKKATVSTTAVIVHAYTTIFHVYRIISFIGAK